MGHEAAVTLCSQSEDGYLYTLEFTFFFAFSSEPYGILSLTFRLGASPTPSKTF